MLQCCSQSILLVMHHGSGGDLHLFGELATVRTPSHGSGVGPTHFACRQYSGVLLQSVSTPSYGSGVGPPPFGE